MFSDRHSVFTSDPDHAPFVRPDRRTGAIGPRTAAEAAHRRRGVATFGPLVKSLLAAYITGPTGR